MFYIMSTWALMHLGQLLFNIIMEEVINNNTKTEVQITLNVEKSVIWANV